MDMVKNYLKANASTQKTLLHVFWTSFLGQAFTPAWANSIQQCKMVKTRSRGTYCMVPALFFMPV